MMRFRSIAKECGREEASFYLEEADWDIKRALDAYRADLQWETNAPQPRKARVPPPHSALNTFDKSDRCVLTQADNDSFPFRS